MSLGLDVRCITELRKGYVRIFWASKIIEDRPFQNNPLDNLDNFGLITLTCFIHIDKSMTHLKKTCSQVWY